MAIAIEQSATNGAQATSVAVTLPEATTNGNYLLVLAGRVAEVGNPALSVTSAGAWQELLSEPCTSEAGAYLFAAMLRITSAENSVTVGYTGNAENLSVTLFEVSLDPGLLALEDSVLNDLAGTGQTVPLGSVDALTGDLIVAVANFHDDDPGLTPIFSNSFVMRTENIEASGVPDQAFVTGSLVAGSDAAYSTTCSWPDPPAADERDGFMLVLRDYPFCTVTITVTVTVVVME